MAAIAMSALTAVAGDADSGKSVMAPAPGPFDRGSWELEGGSGFFGSFSSSAARRVTINYEFNDLRVGWMYDSPRHNGFWRGNNEFMLEAFEGVVTKGPGTYLAGGAVVYRYNFIQPGAHWAPYLQLSAGMLGNNIYEGRQQREIGQSFNFLLSGAAGLKYLINDQWQVSAEVAYRHISDASMSARNEGLNSLGGLMQISYMFR